MMKKRISPLAAIHVKKLPPTTSATVSLCQKGQALSTRLLFKRDDAAALYLNGAEIFRDNNLTRNAGHHDYATANVPEENTFIEAQFDPALLLPGNNLIAAEVHQGNATSSDLSFDLELSGTLRAKTSVTIVVEEGSPAADTDADGLPDSWEQEHFGINGTTPTADPDADGIVNLIEYALATDLPSQQGLAPSLATNPEIF